MLSRCHRLIYFACFVLPLFALTGCGKSDLDRANVSGQVSFDGKPIEVGTIAFVPTGDTKGPVSGGRIENGTYTLTGAQGAVIGSHKVEITGTRKTGEKIPAVPPATGEMELTEQFIPEKYNKQTTLTADIVAGTNEKDFELSAN
ncbi:MAG: hypothetical protein O2955_17725 [Planctomycetota bacterium]|nr:hypothetical protein [Planctomycetota bacterium]MDA1214352.1 hypothetical protein [Planctomycetota bacterium]